MPNIYGPRASEGLIQPWNVAIYFQRPPRHPQEKKPLAERKTEKCCPFLRNTVAKRLSLPNSWTKRATRVQSVFLCVGNKAKYCDYSQFHSPMYVASDAEIYKTSFRESLWSYQLRLSSSKFILCQLGLCSSWKHFMPLTKDAHP